MRIGLIGAGMIGGTLARMWAEAGHELLISSRHPETLAELAASLGPSTRAGTPVQAATHGEVVVLSVPFGATPALAAELAELVTDKVVVDTGNPFPRRDGRAADAALGHPHGSLGYVADHLPGALLVKALNTIFYRHLRSRQTRHGEPLAVPLVGHAQGRDVVAGLVRDVGLVPVDVGDLDACPRIDPGSRIWNRDLCEASLRAELGL